MMCIYVSKPPYKNSCGHIARLVDNGIATSKYGSSFKIGKIKTLTNQHFTNAKMIYSESGMTTVNLK